MNHVASPNKETLRKITRLRRTAEPVTASDNDADRISNKSNAPGSTCEIKVICLYPSVAAGKLAREWIETALRTMAPTSSSNIEYFNYDVLAHDGISWGHVVGRMHPDIILMVGDGKHTLGSGLRHSLRELLSQSNGSEKPKVIFRDLDPEPTLNTKVLLDYVSALTRLNHCELSAMNGNGTPISCYRHPQYLLKPRKHHE